jgi:hypothetical protein
MIQQEQQFLADLAVMTAPYEPRISGGLKSSRKIDSRLKNSSTIPETQTTSMLLLEEFFHIMRAEWEDCIGASQIKLAHVKTALFESTKELLGCSGKSWVGNGTTLPSSSFSARHSSQAHSKKIIYQRPDFPETVVPDTAAVAKQVRFVVSYEGPDLTNMPSYLIRCGSSFSERPS